MPDEDNELSLPVENPFEVAAKRVRNAVKPEGGRKEGEFTKQFTESANMPSAIALKLLTGPFYAAGDIPGFINEFMQRTPGSDLTKEEVERGFNAAAITGAGAGLSRVTSEMRAGLPLNQSLLENLKTKIASKAAPIAEDQSLLDHIIERGKEFEKEPQVQEMTQNKINPNNPVEINAAPNMPQRSLGTDYPGIRFSDAPNGVIQNDIEGRPLTAPIVAGRRIIGSGDQGLSSTDIHRVATEGVQATVNPTPRSQFAPGEAGSYNTRKNFNAPEHLTERNIKFNMALDSLMRDRVVAHEVAHGIEHRSVGDDPWFAGGGYHISSKNMRDEMYRVYNDMNNENPAMIGKHPINENGHIGEGIEAPELRGYAPQKVPRELWAESIRAYMDNPNYMKTVAPETAKAIRQMVNSNPQLSKIIQFNAEGSVPGAAIAALSKPFYSAVENAIKGAKQSTANADQWLGTIKNSPGIKQEELNWTGLEDYIKSKQGKISKQELQDYMDNHKVELNEVNKGELKFNKKNKYAIPEVIKAVKESGENPGELELTLANDGNAYRALMKKFPELKNNEDWAELVSKEVFGGSSMPTGTNKYSQYQLPGGENYREKLLTLPVRKNINGLPEGYDLINENEIAKQKGYNVPENAEERWSYKGHGVSSKIFKSREEAIEDAHKTAKNMGNEGTYKSSHWDEPNVLAHVRMNDRNIPDVGKTLHLEEIQSDWHQAGREKGYKGDNHRNQNIIQKELQEAYDNLIKTPNAENKAAYDRLNAERAAASEIGTVPNAPFKATWPDLVLKQMIREASEKGYDAISWSPGEVQNKRYPGRGIKEEEGMKEFYDKILVNKVNQLAKKFGGKVEEKNLNRQYSDKEILAQAKKDHRRTSIEDWGDMMQNEREAYVRSAKEKLNTQSQNIHVLKLTKELKDTALHKGFPLFSNAHPGMMFTPIDNHPDHKFSPVDHNPFEDE